MDSILAPGTTTFLMHPAQVNKGSTASPKNQEDYQQYFFSPSFQCYTSPLFYRSLLLELEWVASVVDDCKEEAREIVWNQLFILSGAPKGLKSTKKISPIISGWTESSTMNLLAIELLYLAFATALNQYPDFIKNNITAKHHETVANLGSVHSFVPQNGTFNSPNYSHTANTTNSSPCKPNISYNRCPPTVTTNSYSNGTINDNHVFVTTNGSSHRWHDNGSRKDITSRLSPGNGVTKNVGNEQKEEDSDVDIFKKLIELQSWKEMLDSQPQDIKNRVWNVLKECDNRISTLSGNSFSSTINMWAQDIVPNMNLISALHSVVSNLLMPSQLGNYPGGIRSDSMSNHHNPLRPHGFLYNGIRSNDTTNGASTPSMQRKQDMKNGNSYSSSLPRISVLESSHSTDKSKSNPSERFTMPPLSNIPNPRASLDMYVTNSRQLPSLPPLQASFSSKSNSPLHAPPYSPVDNDISLQKRKERYFDEPQAKRMKMDFLNS